MVKMVNLQLIAESQQENQLAAENERLKQEIRYLENIIRELKG